MVAARALMFQGTGSDVGKSLIVAGLARAFANRGLAVRPFKPQNMSNNAAVTADGGEIGRAQALQARAARTPPSVHMNPVLLKPQSEVGAQIVVQGRVHGTAKAAAYQRMKPDLLPFVLDSFARLKAEADIVLVEGAGSASEVNLRANDIANMGFARAADVPVVLIGDIDRGGVIASLVGTRMVIDAARRGAGPRLSRQQVSRRSGAVRRRHGDDRAHNRLGGARPRSVLSPTRSLLPAEDALALDRARPSKPAGARSDRGPDPAAHRQFRRSRSARCGARGRPRARAAGERASRRCRSRHPAGLEGDHRRSRGAAPGGLRHRHRRASAPRRHRARAVRRLPDARAHHRRSGRHRGSAPARPKVSACSISRPCCPAKSGSSRCAGETSDGIPFSGYEMHMGVTRGADCARPFARLADGSPEGAVSADGRVIGTYIHGLFADDRQRSAWLARLGAGPSVVAYERWSKTRSTASRRTLPPMSISTGCSACRGDDEREERDEPDQHRVGTPIERKRGANIRRRGVAAAISHDGVLDLRRRHRRAGPQARDRARRPSPPRDSPHSGER